MADEAPAAGGAPADDRKKKIDLTPDEILGAIEGLPEGIGSVAPLTGYVAESPKPDHIRLYFDLDKKSYCDIPVGEVVHRERFTRPDAPNASRVFVRSDYKVTVVRTVEVQASFLQGGIAATHPIRDTTKQACQLPVIVPQTIISQTVCVLTTPTCTVQAGQQCQPQVQIPQTIISQTVCVLTTPTCPPDGPTYGAVLSLVAPDLCRPK